MSCTAAEQDRVAKTQAIRVLDVVLIGPLMVWGGARVGGWAGWLLAGFGVSTICYNAHNFRRVARFSAANPPAA